MKNIIFQKVAKLIKFCKNCMKFNKIWLIFIKISCFFHFFCLFFTFSFFSFLFLGAQKMRLLDFPRACRWFERMPYQEVQMPEYLSRNISQVQFFFAFFLIFLHFLLKINKKDNFFVKKMMQKKPNPVNPNFTKNAKN